MSYVKSSEPLEMKFHQADEKTKLSDEESFDDDSDKRARRMKKFKRKLRRMKKRRRLNAEALSDDAIAAKKHKTQLKKKIRNKLKNRQRKNRRANNVESIEENYQRNKIELSGRRNAEIGNF
jgi:hypothetical protein